MVDLYSSDAVKGTVEEYMPAFGECALKRQIVLAITASLLCSSYVRVLDRFGPIVVSWIVVSLPPVRATKMETSCQL